MRCTGVEGWTVLEDHLLWSVVTGAVTEAMESETADKQGLLYLLFSVVSGPSAEREFLDLTSIGSRPAYLAGLDQVLTLDVQTVYKWFHVANMVAFGLHFQQNHTGSLMNTFKAVESMILCVQKHV